MDINIYLHDRVVGGLMDTVTYETQERGVEEGLGGTETLIADGDDLTVGKLIRLLDVRGSFGGVHFILKVESNIAEPLLDATHDFMLCRVGEGVATIRKDRHEVVCQVTASEVETNNGVGKSEALVDGDGIGGTISRVEDNTVGTTRSEEGEDGLVGDVESGGFEGLEHDLGHLFAVILGIERSLGQEDGVILRSNVELLVEDVMPNLLHAVPVSDKTMLDGVLQGEDTML
jgi:hypothetical protein